jgi:hypothetical protein
MFDSVSISTAAHAKPETESVECGFEMSRVIAGNGTLTPVGSLGAREETARYVASFASETAVSG